MKYIDGSVPGADRQRISNRDRVSRRLEKIGEGLEPVENIGVKAKSHPPVGAVMIFARNHQTNDSRHE